MPRVRSFWRAAGAIVGTLLMAGSLAAVAATAPASAAPGSAAHPAATAISLGDTIPAPVKSGRAINLGHYASNQTLRVVIALKTPHPAEEEAFLQEISGPEQSDIPPFPYGGPVERAFRPDRG